MFGKGWAHESGTVMLGGDGTHTDVDDDDDDIVSVESVKLTE